MNRIKSVMLLTLLSLLLMAIGGVFGGRQGALIMLLVSFVINFISYWNSDKIALASYRAQPISPEQAPELHKLVKQLADNAGIAMPRLYLIPTDVPNAFATGRDDKHAAVAVTEGLLRILNRDEVAGVISHELSHIKHRDTLVMTLAASLASAISYIANIAQWGLIFGHRGDDRGRNPLALLLTIIVAPIAATLIQLALSRSREFMADASGAAISGNHWHWRVLCRNLTIMHIIAFCQVLSRKPKGCLSLTRSAEKAAFRICFQRILLRKSVLKSCAKLQQI